MTTTQLQTREFFLRNVPMGKLMRLDIGDGDIRTTYMFDVDGPQRLELSGVIADMLSGSQYPLQEYSTPLRDGKLRVKIPRGEQLPLNDHGIIRDVFSCLFVGQIVDIKIDLVLADVSPHGQRPVSLVFAVARGFKLVGGMPTGLVGL